MPLIWMKTGEHAGRFLVVDQAEYDKLIESGDGQSALCDAASVHPATYETRIMRPNTPKKRSRKRKAKAEPAPETTEEPATDGD